MSAMVQFVSAHTYGNAAKSFIEKYNIEEVFTYISQISKTVSESLASLYNGTGFGNINYKLCKNDPNYIAQLWFDLPEGFKKLGDVAMSIFTDYFDQSGWAYDYDEHVFCLYVPRPVAYPVED